MDLRSELPLKISGYLELYSCPDGKDPLNTRNCSPILAKKNLIVNSAKESIVNLLAGVPGYRPTYITIGNGGDYDQVSKTDTGLMSPAMNTDTSVRRLIYRLPIVTQEILSDSSWRYVAIAEPESFTANDIDEFAVETGTHTLISHVITEESGPGARATKYAKSHLEYLIVKWTFTLSLDTSSSVQQPTIIDTITVL